MKHIARLLLSREFCARSAFSCALAALLAAPAAHASFLGDLAARADRVASSPYATGGDVILALNAAEYVHVFTNTAAAATFTPAADMAARVLVVGGGGGGGRYTYNACGGAGGGVVEETISLAGETDYAIVAGAGGKPSNNGKQSSFGGTALVAGGGTQGNINATNAGRLSGTPQCNSGGTETKGAGGGGAGGVGSDAISGVSFGLRFGWGGQGGPGIQSDITGWTVEYGAGGNGGHNSATWFTPANGGGGLGFIKDWSVSDYNSSFIDGTAADPGTGSGGGGQVGHRGALEHLAAGDGVVVVRYVAWSGTVPFVASASVQAGGPTHARASVRLASPGAADSATLKVRVRKAGETAWGAARELGDDAGGPASEALVGFVGGLDPGTAYEWEAWASNSSGDSAALSGSFTTLASDAVATGGAVSTNGVRRIHVFTENGTLSLPAAVQADVLVVGGGGSGGNGNCGGGGGGGQVIYRTAVSLPAGSYPVAIGAGGTSIDVANNAVWGTVNSEETAAAAAGAMGGDSAFNGETAHGGGPGGAGSGYGARILTGWFRGASGGGASNGLGNPSVGGLSAYWDAGHNGGSDGSGNKYGSGGGGAGGAGAGSTSSAAGEGGSGFACAITGETVYYGAGGGGATSQKTGFGAGGSGVGGDGGHAYDKTVDASEVAARNGKDGAANTGSGGGGAYGSYDTTTYIGGTGADGVVIVSYVDYSLLSGVTAPVLEGPSELAAAADSLSFRLNVVSSGGGDGTVSLVAHRFYEDGTAEKTQTLSAAAIGDGRYTMTGLVPGVSYTFHVAVDNGETGGTTNTASVAFTAAPMFTEALSFSASGGRLCYVIDGAATCDSETLEVWLGADEASLALAATYSDASLMTAGSHSVTPFTADQFGETLCAMVRHVAVADGRAFTNDTAVLTATLQDAVTYTWKSDVADGLWCDAANWTSTGGMRGWPTAGSTASFPACTATARIDRALTIYQTQFTAKGNVTLRGTASGASLTTRFNRGQPFSEGALTLDALDVVVPSQSGIQVKLDSAASLVITNGASFTSAIDCVLNNSTASLVIAAGSTFSARVLGGVGTSGKAMPKMIVAGTAEATYDFRLTYDGAANKPALNLVLDGPSARVKTGNGNFNAANSNATVTVNLTPGAYSATEALIRQTGGSTKMANSGCTIVFSAPASEGSKALGGCEILVADWSRSSINTALVEFGEVDCEGSYFYYTQDSSPLPKTVRRKSAAEVAAAGETAKYLWYHHAPPSGTVLSVK